MIIKLIILQITLLIFTSCANSHTNTFSNSSSITNSSCFTPANPYSNGTGHFAGYERAEEKGRICSGKSNSFVEGCEEYYRLLNEYNKCK